MAVTSPPPGVFVPVPTFFRPASEAASSSPPALQAAVDVETQAQHGVFLARSGITGLVLLGSTGEAIHLSRAERSALVSGVRAALDEAGFPGYPVMAGVLTNGVDETLEWLRDYAAAGAQWGLVLVPGYFGVAANQENIREWFTLIADNSPLPILMLVVPPLRCFLLAGGFQADMVRKIQATTTPASRTTSSSPRRHTPRWQATPT